MILRHSRLLLAVGLISAAVTASVATAAPTGGFFSVIDSDTGVSGDSARSVVFFNFAIQDEPLFSVFVPFEDGLEDPDALAVDPSNGDVYVVAFDSGTPGVIATQNDGEPDTIGDLDLFRINFQQVYSDWEDNQAMAYTSYYSQPALSGPGHTNPIELSNAVQKIGEVGRSQGGPTYNRALEFVNSSTLLLLDNDIATDTDTGDHEIRALNKIVGAAGYNPTTNEGGYNSNTDESWESTIIGRVNLDGPTASEPKSIAYIDRDGIKGVWLGDEDMADGDPETEGFQPLPVGDDIAFFQITNFNGTSGNALREFNVGPGPTYPNDFQLDDDPVTDPNTNDGNHDKIFVNRQTGQLVIVESGFDDDLLPSGDDEVSVITRGVDSYNDTTNIPGGQIDFGAWGYSQLNPVGNDDSGFFMVGAYTVYDEENNEVYFWDWDGGAGVADLWKLDLGDGTTTLIKQDVDEIFMPASDNRDTLGFVWLSDVDPNDGDLDDDGDVDSHDIDTLWNIIRPEVSGSDDPNANDDEDLNEDGFVNEDDVDFMLANLLTAGTNRQYGDADLDGGVGGLDYTAWRLRAGTGWANGDFDGDGGVGGLDYTLWRTRPTVYPTTVGPHAGGGPQVVPEPASLVLLGLGLPGLAFVAYRRRRS